MLTISTRTPWGVAVLLLYVLLFPGCRGGRVLEIEEGAVLSAVPSSPVHFDPSVHLSLDARSPSRPSALQVAVERPPAAPSPPQRSTSRATPDYSKIPIELRRRIYMEAVLRDDLRNLAFGKQAWAQHLGNVGEEPPLPHRIINILDSPCPFWEGQKVKDTHLLVLIPATVNGERLTLNKLGELIKLKREFSNNDYGYCYYDSRVRKALGNAPLSEAPYWLLMTRKVLPGSLNTSYSDQQAMANRYSNYGYRLPFGLEAATCILSHYVRSDARKEQLSEDDSSTYTRCTATQLVTGLRPLVVGGFAFAGLDVSDSDSIAYYADGVACCRKL